MQDLQTTAPGTAFDAREFRNTLGDFATGVTVIACDTTGQPQAMTANAFTSVSLDPPLVLVSVATRSSMLKRLNRGAPFSISFLASPQEAIARCYGSSRNQPDALHWTERNALPVIAGAAAHMGCAVKARHRHGDHMVIVARVEWIARDQQHAVLTFHRGRFGSAG